MTTYRVEGMTCQHCQKSVEGALKERAPDAQIHVDLDSKQVSIDQLSAQDVEDIVEGLGFDYKGQA